MITRGQPEDSVPSTAYRRRIHKNF